MMDATTATTILITVFGILVSIIAFWLKRFVEEVKQIRELLNSIQIMQSANTAACTERHRHINVELDQYQKNLEKHDEEFKTIFGKINPK